MKLSAYAPDFPDPESRLPELHPPAARGGAAPHRATQRHFESESAVIMADAKHPDIEMDGDLIWESACACSMFIQSI